LRIFLFLLKYTFINFYPEYTEVIVLEFFHSVSFFSPKNHTTPADAVRAVFHEHLGLISSFVLFFPFRAPRRANGVAKRLRKDQIFKAAGVSIPVWCKTAGKIHHVFRRMRTPLETA
jgi:hypothetical protein